MNETGLTLEDIGLTMRQVCALRGHDRRRLLNFLLHWEQFEVLHRCLDALIPRHPTLVSLRDLRAKALLAQGRTEEALAVAEERVEWNASMPARRLLARIQLARDDVSSARRIAQDLIQEAGESAMAWGLLGEVESATGNEEAALSAYRQLHSLYPNSRAYLRGMANLYSMRGDWVTASGYAVELLRLGDEGSSLSVAYLRGLRDHFRASGEPTRVVEIEAELARRYADELADLREQISSGRKPRGSSRSAGRRDESRSTRPVEPLPSYDAVPVSDGEHLEITRAAQRLFGFDALLPGQLETIACVLRGEDVLTILPTGGGKSLCYQLPAMMALLASEEPGDTAVAHSTGPGTTLVISPLIALMKDQVDSLPRGVQQRATTINSTLDGDELRRRMDRVADGAYRLVYAAPERLRQPPFLHALGRAGLARLVIDEAHCVSMWGHDFRPDYLIIGQVRQDLGNPPLLAMTATAPLRVRREVVQRLGPPRDGASDPRIVAGDLARSNLQLEVFRAQDNDDKLRCLLAFCQAETGSGIVYADTRARCEELASLLRRHGVNAEHYHAGIAERHQVQDDFMAGRIRVVVATIAFGMGIDKPDIRFIVHFFPPASLESYYQEAGRAGRDGLPARCLLMYSPYDRGMLTRRTRRDVLPIEFLREVYAAAKKRLNGRSAGRVTMADLERDLQTDDTRIRVALSLLEEAELLRRGPDLPRGARIKLTAVCQRTALPQEVSAFRDAARLRSQQWLTVDLAEVALRAGIPLAEIENKVLTWEDAGWLTYRPAGRDLLLTLLPPPPDATERMHELLERHEAVQTQRVGEIFAYAKTPRCRHGHLNAYLGGRMIERCDACDRCVDIPALPDPALPDERAQLLTILRVAANAPWGWGRQTLVRILRGDGGARYAKRSLHPKALDQAEFAALDFRSRTAIKKMVEGLERAEFLKPRRLGHGGVVLDLTDEGRAALKDPSRLTQMVTFGENHERDGAVVPASVRNDEEQIVDEALLNALRSWRLERARAQEVSAFIVFHDSHLRAIAARRPTTLEALAEVKGVGPRKLEKYGAAVISLVAEHLEGGGD